MQENESSGIEQFLNIVNEIKEIEEDLNLVHVNHTEESQYTAAESDYSVVNRFLMPYERTYE